MEDIFLSTEIGNSKRICISSISHKTYRSCVGSGLGGDMGYFVYETDDSCPDAGISVLAKAASFDAAMRLFEFIVGGGRAATA
jgi:hypothetical protein